MIAIQKLTGSDLTKKMLENALAVRMNDILRRVAWIAEGAVNTARNLPSPPVSARAGKHTPNYIDETGNLRSSIGYLLVYDGKVIVENFMPQPRKASGSEGVSAAQKMARDAIEGNAKGLQLVLTAGMKYARFVAAKGYDVLDSAELFCKSELEKLIKSYGK